MTLIDDLQAMREEVLSGLERVADIKVQPRFLEVEGQEGESPDSDLSHRMIAVDSMRSLGEITWRHKSTEVGLSIGRDELVECVCLVPRIRYFL